MATMASEDVAGGEVQQPLPSPEGQDHVSFEAWYSEHATQLVRTARLMARGDDVEDLVVDACVKLMARWNSRRPANPTAWALTVVVNARRRQRLRSGRRDERLQLVAAADSVEQELPDVDLEDAIRALPRRQRSAIALRYGADLSQAETAEVMGIAPGTAAALLNNARRNLRAQLEETGE